MKDRLTAIICAYQEERLLPGCLESLVGKVDRIVLADGRYRLFPGEAWESTDRTLEIAAEYGCDVIPAPADGWESEHAKRTALIRSGEYGDEYLVLDADERLVAEQDIRHLYGDYKVAIIGTHGTNWRTDAVRLFAHRDGMSYAWHYGLFTASTRPVLRARHTLPQTVCWIDHRHADREPERIAADKSYEAELVPFETAIMRGDAA